MSLTFRLTIDTDNEAFLCGSHAHADDPQGCGQRARETARILRETADRLERGDDDFLMYRTLFDVNGNDVGRAAFKTPEPVPEPKRRRRIKPSRPMY